MIDPEVLVEDAHALCALRGRFEELDYVCRRFQRGEKTVLGGVVQRLEGKSFEARRLAAYADPEYCRYLGDWERAEKARMRAHIEFENREVLFEARQSVCAHQREAIKRGIA